MGTRFIHKGGRIIPIHSDHGDQQNARAHHASPMNPPNTPAPVVGHENTNHPEARVLPESTSQAAPQAAHPSKHQGNMEGLKKAREAREYNKAHPVMSKMKKLFK